MSAPGITLISVVAAVVAAASPVLGDLDLQGERRRLLTVRRVPGVNHMLQTATRGTMDEHMLIDETIAPAVLRHVDDWLSRVAPAVPHRTVPTPR